MSRSRNTTKPAASGTLRRRRRAQMRARKAPARGQGSRCGLRHLGVRQRPVRDAHGPPPVRPSARTADFDPPPPPTGQPRTRKPLRLNNKPADAYIPIAVAAAVKGQYDEADGWYQAMGRAGGHGVWLSEVALADLEVVRGRSGDAEQRLMAPPAQPSRAARKLATSGATRP
jgi:hypothetical protein